MSECLSGVTTDSKNGVVNQLVKFAQSGFINPGGGYLGIKVTDKAREEMYKKVALKPNSAGIRISIVTKGCSGLSYKMEYAEYGINITEKDELIEYGSVRVFVDPKSSLFLFGLEIDYESDGIQSGFKFNNPGSKGACGCGESFFV